MLVANRGNVSLCVHHEGLLLTGERHLPDNFVPVQFYQHVIHSVETPDDVQTVSAGTSGGLSMPGFMNLLKCPDVALPKGIPEKGITNKRGRILIELVSYY